MRCHSADLISSLASIALLLEYAAASISSRESQEVEITVTHKSNCKHKSSQGDTIEVHYNGTLADGTPFDSSYTKGDPLEFTLGNKQVIEGWEDGLLDMCEGERRTLKVPPNKGYGYHSMGAIPSASTLMFDTLLVSITPATGDSYTEEQEEPPNDSPDEEAFGIQTAPAEPPKPQATSPPSSDHEPEDYDEEDISTDEEGEEDGEEHPEPEPEPEPQPEAHEPTLDELMNHGPISMPTALPDLPVTGLSAVNTAPAAVASQQPVTRPHLPSEDEPGAVDGECRLLGPFALIVQACLGVLALSSLVFKRWRERPRRPFKIWFFDVSKQVVGTMLLHILNLLMSMFSAADFELAHKAQELSVSLQTAQSREVNPCSWYLINIAIDTTIGIPILIILLRILHHAFLLTPLARPAESIKSGHYGQPPRATWWVKQSFIYFIGLVIMKLCIFIIIQLLPWIAAVGDWALRWTEGNASLQIGFVMFVFPLVMNALQYYIIDSFIKDPSAGHERLPADDDSSSSTQEYTGVEHRDSLDSEDEEPGKDRSRTALLDPIEGRQRERVSPSRTSRLKDA